MRILKNNMILVFLFILVYSATGMTYMASQTEEKEIVTEIAEPTTAEILTQEPATPIMISTEKEIIRPVYFYTDEEFLVLANLIYFEAGNEPYEVKEFCASVVLNRVFDDSGDFPDDLLGVIYQKRQFSPASSQNLKIFHEEVTQECYDAAKNILTYGSVLPKEIMVFYGQSDTGWVRTRKVYETHSRTTFAYLREVTP